MNKPEDPRNRKSPLVIERLDVIGGPESRFLTEAQLEALARTLETLQATAEGMRELLDEQLSLPESAEANSAEGSS